MDPMGFVSSTPHLGGPHSRCCRREEFVDAERCYVVMEKYEVLLGGSVQLSDLAIV